MATDSCRSVIASIFINNYLALAWILLLIHRNHLARSSFSVVT